MENYKLFTVVNNSTWTSNPREWLNFETMTKKTDKRFPNNFQISKLIYHIA